MAAFIGWYISLPPKLAWKLWTCLTASSRLLWLYDLLFFHRNEYDEPNEQMLNFTPIGRDFRNILRAETALVILLPAMLPLRSQMKTISGFSGGSENFGTRVAISARWLGIVGCVSRMAFGTCASFAT